MPGPAVEVSPPTTKPSPYGLLSVAQPATPGAAGEHWRNGVYYGALCGLTANNPGGAVTFDDFCAVSGVASKAETAERFWRGATPFSAYAQVECSPVAGFWESTSFADAQELAAQALQQSEGWQVERAFWTGSPPVGAVNLQVYPHLAANTVVLSPSTFSGSFSVTLQTAATVITGTVDPVEGLGWLEKQLANCYGQQGVIHVTPLIAVALDSYGLLKKVGAQLQTLAGNLVAVGNGYPGTGPDGTQTSGVEWMYATGQVFIFRSDQVQFRREESLDRTENTLKQIAERTFVLGWDCCHFGIPISTGGRATGTVSSPA
jgi:hypothetical protein